MNINKWRSSIWLLILNSLVKTLNNKKKLNIGNSKVIEKINICMWLKSKLSILFLGINPPDEITVNAKLKESKSLKFIKLNRKIMKTVLKK